MLTPEEQEAVDNLCDKYRGHLPVEQIADGIAACIANAEQLRKDGVALLNAGRFARAMSVFITGMEEVGKVSVLCSMARVPHNNQALWKEFWKDFRSHEHKATRAFVHTYDDDARQYPDLIIAASVWQYSLSPLGERLRHAGLYVDFHAKQKRWLSPAEVTEYDARLWLNRLQPALARVQQFAALGLCSPEALAIQRDVYGPINADRPKRKDLTPQDSQNIRDKALAAVREYYRRIVDAGIVPRDADIEIMGVRLADFISST